MIISFGFNGAGGGGGTSDYSQLSNKPQINGVTLNGNQSSSDLGITSESLEPVAIVPSGASVGEIYATTKSQTVGYGWEEIENGYAFNFSLNPASGDTSVDIGQFVGNGNSTTISIWPNGMVDGFGDSVKAGFTRRNEFDGGYVNENHYDYHRIEFTFEGIDVPTLQNAISSVSKTIVENKAVQVEAADVPLAHWEFWTQYQGRYQEIQFWLEQNGQKDFLPNTELGLFSYYQLYFKLYTNADGFFCVDYSNDSAVTWNHYIQNANIPVSEPEYYPIDITDPNGKQALFKAWFRSGDGNFGVIIKSNKYLWLDNYVTPNGCLWVKLVNENELPAPAAGGVQTHWVPYTDFQTYAMEGKCNYVRGDIGSDGDYYCSVGQIDGEQKALIATISNGAITGINGQLYSNEINGHYYITVKDSNENTYGAQCWVDNGKLYWQVYGTTIVHLDNSELGTNWEAGFIY